MEAFLKYSNNSFEMFLKSLITSDIIDRIPLNAPTTFDLGQLTNQKETGSDQK